MSGGRVTCVSCTGLRHAGTKEATFFAPSLGEEGIFGSGEEERGDGFPDIVAFGDGGLNRAKVGVGDRSAVRGMRTGLKLRW